jgi:hypothetical protein
MAVGKNLGTAFHRSISSWQVTQYRAQGKARNRFNSISCPQLRHWPKFPASKRAMAAFKARIML